MFPCWWKNLFRFTGPKRLASRVRDRGRFRPAVESLNDRTLPSAAFPFVQSINRVTPAGPITNASSVSYAVTFSESVTGVNATDFQVSTTGTVGTTLTQVTPSGPAMFYIGFRDIDHAQIGLAWSGDGVTQWQRHPANPIISPSTDGWDRDAVYKPFAILDGKRWLLWYNGRRGGAEQIGLAMHDGVDLGFK
jgi:hypothetical protein